MVSSQKNFVKRVERSRVRIGVFLQVEIHDVSDKICIGTLCFLVAAEVVDVQDMKRPSIRLSPQYAKHQVHDFLLVP